MKQATIGDVASRAGVSISTVSNIFNHPEKVSPDTKDAVLRAVSDLGYVRNRHASALAGQKEPALGLLVTGLDHGLPLGIANGTYEAAEKAGFDLLIASANNDYVINDHYIDFFQGTQMSGLILAPRPKEHWKPSHNLTVPSVITDFLGSPNDGCFVGADNLQVGVLAIKHAASLNRRHLAVVTSSEDIQTLRLRMRGIREEIRNHPEMTLEFMNANDWRDPKAGYEIGKELASRPYQTRPDFIIGITDVLAAGVIEGILSTDCSVPEDIAVMGCDGNPMAWCGSMPLTSIVPTGFDIGVQAVRLLLDEINSEHHQHSTIVNPVHLLVRESTIGRQAHNDAEKNLKLINSSLHPPIRR